MIYLLKVEPRERLGFMSDQQSTTQHDYMRTKKNPNTTKHMCVCTQVCVCVYTHIDRCGKIAGPLL